MSRKFTQQEVEKFLMLMDAPSESETEYILDLEDPECGEIEIEIDLDEDK